MPWTSQDSHVAAEGFGVGIGIEDYFVRYLEYFKDIKGDIKNFDGLTHEMLQREAYETIFGVTNLEDASEPLGLIRYTNADTLGDIGSVAEIIQEFRNNELKDKFGLSIKEYFELPVSVAKLIVSAARTEKEDTDQIVKDAERQANREWKKNKI